MHYFFVYSNFTHYRKRFTTPGNTEGLFYSYNIGRIHIISMNTEVYYFPKVYTEENIQIQRNWLKEDLMVSFTLSVS